MQQQTGPISASAGRAVLVTGASSGLGAHFCRLLARSGYFVIAGARRMAAIEALVAEIKAAGGQADGVLLDVNDPASVSTAVAAAGALHGGLYGLVNNAGIADAVRLLDQSVESWDAVHATNLRGAFLVAQAAARQMTETGGVIVNVASILGLRQGGTLAAYASSKAALVQLTKQMALEWARYGIRVNALAPGYFETELNAAFFATDAGRAMTARVPMRRLGRIEELDAPLLLLISAANSFMTGSVIAVDGGHLVSGL